MGQIAFSTRLKRIPLGSCHKIFSQEKKHRSNSSELVQRHRLRRCGRRTSAGWRHQVGISAPPWVSPPGAAHDQEFRWGMNSLNLR